MSPLLPFAAALLLLGVSYYLFPLSWGRLLLFLERTRSGLRSRRVTAGGRVFHYLEGGRNRDDVPVVLLHGFGASSDHWTSLGRILRWRFRLLAPDLPGFGATAASPSESFSIPLQAERVRAFLGARGVRRYHLVANSMGGNIAGQLAHDFPDEVQSLTLLEPQGIESREPSLLDVEIREGAAPLVPETPAQYARLVELAFVKRPFIPRTVHAYLCKQALDVAALHRVVWRDLLDPEHAYQLEKNLAGIRVPTLVIWGDSDRFLHQSAIEKLERSLPDVRVVRMRACGHTPMLERPAEVARHFTRFHDSLGRTAVR
jgi:pimeloyl-ACP methyl ester carboxylesterase